ncbi:hypothetical protein CIRG_06341 [Coccidioides immitis RMSCC 2394]|uniref:Uncharacterized protein n=1 Tax=Coccidioides immitis RMSCC 2394 TaxID=404692 RepID=A0A0J6YGB5_COCIT|nr:hypothetical protein CIRG_06341 [Coccidioides immitis RMSCC 2394]
MASIIESGVKSTMSLCRTCHTTRIQARLFSSSPSSMVGPESPNYIDIPRTIQPYLPRKKRAKGVLPVPREIFPARRPDKPSESYIANATPEPASNKPKVDNDNPLFEQLEWKRRMAAVRRKNLREGLLELHERKQKTESKVLARSKARQAQNRQVLNQPSREDERLTSATIVQAMVSKKNPILPDPNAEARLAKSLANVAMKQQLKSEERMDAIHSLYMNARDFIITEEQLNEEIERVFPAGDNPEWMNDQRAGENVWNLGPPPTVSSLVHRKDDENSRWDLVQDRTKKIAEALTGGKI